MTIRIPKALFVALLLGVIALAAGLGGYVLGRESRADDVARGGDVESAATDLRAKVRQHDENTFLRMQNLCRAANEVRNRTGGGVAVSPRDACTGSPFNPDTTDRPGNHDAREDAAVARICDMLGAALGQAPGDRDNCVRGSGLVE